MFGKREQIGPQFVLGGQTQIALTGTSEEPSKDGLLYVNGIVQPPKNRISHSETNKSSDLGSVTFHDLAQGV
jgi:hypothetical protein